MNDEYLKARKMGEKEYKARAAEGENPYLTALDDILPENTTMAGRHVGLMEIPVRQIAGTKTRGRQNSFSAGFMPLLEPESEFGTKWISLYNAQMAEGFNDPIKVYEYLHKFYVVEGNKRVSVSRYLDNPNILADVTRLMPSEEVLKENPVYAEFLDFYKLCPIYEIECSTVGAYPELTELLIKSFGSDGDLPTPWPAEMIRTVQSSYFHFTEVFKTLSGKPTDLDDGEAYIVYLRVYVQDALKVAPTKEVDKRVKKIKNELLTAANDEKIALVEETDEKGRAAAVPDKPAKPADIIAKTSGAIAKTGEAIAKTGGAIAKTGEAVTKIITVPYSAKHPLKAAFIYDKSPEDSDWSYNHEVGRKRAEMAFGGLVETKMFMEGPYVTNVPGSFETFAEAADAAAEWGANVVFSVSLRQIDDTLRAAIKYDDIIFLNCSINLAHNSVRTYYAKLYEAKFLAGVVAAIEASRRGSHKIGYCSDTPIYGTIAAINAFAIGAAMINPDMKIYLEWSKMQDNDWQRKMCEQGISVISAVDSTHPANGSDAYGVYVIEDGKSPETANNDDCTGEQTCSIRHLCTPIWKWGSLYEIILKTIIDGTYTTKIMDKKDKATNYWWGMISGVVDIELEDTLSGYTKELVGVLKNAIVTGAYNPFNGELRSQDGWIRREGDPDLTSMDIIEMDWLNENIIGEIPEKWTLTDDAQETVKISGVK